MISLNIYHVPTMCWVHISANKPSKVLLLLSPLQMKQLRLRVGG